MSETTFVNTRGIAHKGSGGSSIVFPDVCKTPVGSSIVPIPYSNTGESSDTCEGPKSIRTDGEMPMVKEAKYSTSSGDEAGVGKGVSSGTIKGTCEFLNYSFNVKFEGKNVCRLGDPLFHNNKNTVG